MRALDRKLLRDLRRIWAQSLAIAMVLACGVSILVVAYGTTHTLTETRAAYYERNRFADIFSALTRAPEALAREISQIDGVALVEPRIAGQVVLDMEGMTEPGMARVISLPPDREVRLNLPLIRQGRLPDPLRPEEVAVSEPFAQAHGLQPGDTFRAIMGGQLRELRVSGMVLSPEYIYTIGPASLFPDDRRFGIFWMGSSAAASAFDMDGAFNEVTLGLTRGASEQAVIAALDRLLAPYGGSGAHGRDMQVSHMFLQQELDQLDTMAVLMPPVFFIVSAFLVNMVLGRLIALERQQIGLLKAVGYTTREIATHYMMLSIGIGVAGVLIGWGFGTYLNDILANLYAQYFRFPYLIYVPSPQAFVVSGALAIATVVLGAARAIRNTVRLRPAVAMSPPAPPKFTQGFTDRLGRGLRLRQTSMMILRSITRWPGRAAVTLLGVAASVTVLVGSFFFFDAIEVMIDETFTLSNRQQVTLTLAQPRPLAAIDDARSLPGVLQAEGAYALPVRLSVGPQEKLLPLVARGSEATLSRALDSDGQPIAIPPEGVVMPELLANSLGVAVGDMVSVELLIPPRETHQLPVTAVSRQSMGEELYMNDAALFRLLRQAPQVNQLNLLVDTAALSELYAQVKRTPAVSGVMLFSDVRAQFQAELDESLLAVVFIYSTLGILITVGVVYNAARIQLSERSHELASLRVLGFSRGEVAFVLVGEIMLLAILALPLGWVLGYGFAMLTTTGMSTETINIPLVVSRQTYAWATLIAFVSALASVLVVRRRLDRVEIATALKQKE